MKAAPTAGSAGMWSYYWVAASIAASAHLLSHQGVNAANALVTAASASAYFLPNRAPCCISSPSPSSTALGSVCRCHRPARRRHETANAFLRRPFLEGRPSLTVSAALRGGGDFDEAEDKVNTSASLLPDTQDGSKDIVPTATASRGGFAATAGVVSAPPSTTPPLKAYNDSALDAGSVAVPKLFQILQSHPGDGLSEDEAMRRLQYYGRNALDSNPPQSLLSLFLEQFEDRLVQILLVIAAVSAAFSVLEVQQHMSSIEAATTGPLWKSFVEPFVILLILMLNAVVGVWQSTSATGSLEALQQMQPVVASVVRNSQIVSGIPASELVPGDLIQIRVGDKIPADARLIQVTGGGGLQVDESSLTGESMTVQKLAGDEGTLAKSNSPIQDQVGMLYSGTLVTRGSGMALVTHTGMSTQMGRISSGVTTAALEAPKTPLQRKLDDFSSTLTVIIGVICLAVWIVSIPKMNDPGFPGGVWEGAAYYAKVAVALGVAAIPEGLPAVITLCLSLGTRRMAERNVIVRKLASVETLGCTSVICTDKTGTLTTNEMTAVSLVLVEHDSAHDNQKAGLNDESERVMEHVVQGISYSPIGEVDGIPYQTEVQLQPLGAVADIAAVCALCNDARIIGKDAAATEGDENDAQDVVDGSGKVVKKSVRASSKSAKPATEKAYERVGEPTEAALCVLAEKLGGMAHYLEDSHNYLHDRQGLHFNVPPSVLASANVNVWRDRHQRVATLEFSRDRKSMSVLTRFEQGDYPTPSEFHIGVTPRRAGNRLLVKGAPNLLLERCTHVKFRDGTVARLSGSLRRALETKVSEMAARPLRCLALAIKEHDELEDSLKDFDPQTDRDTSRHPLLSDPNNYRNIESGLCFLGIVGIKDPARPEVADSIKLCTKAGIRVMMITGDAKDTAVAIARDVNIFPPDSDADSVKAFEGRDFFEKPPGEQLDILREGNVVFCRTEPADKQKLVKMLQSLGEIAAMTGDGVNDAPALQQAAIGVAMGVTGTEVSKEAADMILADDNFSTIVSAVEEGRRIYANMQAFICFLISCNIGEICAIFLATLAGFPEPLTAMHLLWVNLVTGTCCIVLLLAYPRNL
jgi:P-type Ca2+ transporter type 2C